SAWGNYEEDTIALFSFHDHRRKIVLEHAGMYPRYLQSGYLVYVTKGTIFTVPFNIDRLEARGPAIRVEEVSSNPTLGFGQMDFSRDGILALRKGRTEGLRTIQWLDRAGSTRSLGVEPGYRINLHLSPDGTRVATNLSQGATTDLW